MVQDKSKATNTDTDSKTEAEVAKVSEKKFNFTRDGVVVTAKDRKEAEKKLKESKKEEAK